jgi:hypothetical protein
MRPIPWSSKLLLVVILSGAVPMACGGKGGTTGSGTTGAGASTGTTTTGTSSGDGGCFADCGNGGAFNQALAINPPSVTINVSNGVALPATVAFTATADGGPVSPSWVVDISSIANVDANGVVTPTGTQGGEVIVKAALNGETATATVTVNIQTAVNPGALSDADQTALKGASDADPGVVWAYPYNGTVFPKGLVAPELMWNGSAGGDRYYIHLKGKYADFEIFTTADPPSRFTLDDVSWKQLTESGHGGPVALHVARLPAGAATGTVIADHSWTIANGSLKGTVYYWSNNLGRVLRIKPGAGTPPEDFLPPQAHDGCSTCHAVSANGSTLVIGGDTSVSVLDLLSNNPVLSLPTVGKPVRNWAMAAVSPNGKVLVENNAPLPGPPGGSDGMWDTQAGSKLAATGLEGAFLDMPAFAPNGTKIAYVDHNTHGLAVYDYDAVNVKASNPVGLVPPGGDGNLNAIVFPSVSPDAKWVVYHRGQYPNSLDTRFGPGSLYLASVDQPGVEQRLAQLDGDAYPFAAGPRDLNYNYEPTFAPLNAGGFTWVVFTSRRTLGNRLTGGPDAVKQLWVAAIDQSPQAGVDPSHPAFWVPGQDANLNMRGFWALDPCKQVGEGCGTGSECCNQNCDTGVCKDPDPNECAQDGNHCEKDGDCCDPTSKCINNICSEAPPH